MIDFLTISLEAHSDERNHHRRYEMSVGRDLLGDWVVTIRYGRVGTALRELRFGTPDVLAARTVARDRLRRRLSALRRIGCRYRLRELSVADDFVLADWMPVPLMNSLTAA